MIIAVVGSATVRPDHDPQVRDAAVARAAAEEVGRELATRGFDLVVYSSRADFVEYCVVRGFAESGIGRPRSIKVLARYGLDDGNFVEVNKNQELFEVIPQSSTDWEVAFYRSLLTIDGLILLGGGRSTFIAGLIGISRRIPVVPVATFGGAAQKLWHYMAREPNYATTEDLSTAAADWHDGSAAAVVSSVSGQQQRRHHADERSKRARRLDEVRTARSLCTGLALLILALLSIPLSYTSRPGTAWGTAILVVAPLFAAMCGAIIRNAFDETGHWLRTTILGAAAGAIAFLLFVAAQLATAPDLLNGEGIRRLLFFVIPVGFIAGLTFDAVYSKLRSQDVTRTSALNNNPPI